MRRPFQAGLGSRQRSTAERFLLAWKNRLRMSDKQPATFEAKIGRLEAIVKELEAGNVELDRAVALFQEGKTLSRECEELLKGAQEQIERTMGDQQRGSTSS